MKIRSPFHLSVFLMAVLTFSLPFTQHTLQAGQSQRKGFATGSHFSSQGSGCWTPPGVRITRTSHVPRMLFAHQLLGKSPEYVVNYTQTGTSTPTISSWKDVLLIGGAVIVGGLFLLVMFAYMENSAFF